MGHYGLGKEESRMTSVTEFATRTHSDLALYKTAQALAALRDRDYAIPDDIKILVPLALAHWLIVKPESQLRGRTAGAILDEILETTELNIGEPE
jgi:MoxR-like ATPase